MNNYFKVFFLTIIIYSCSSDVSNIFNDIGTGDGIGTGDITIPNLIVELITTYDNQTASYSTQFENYTRNFIVHVPPNFDYNTQSLPLLFVLHGYTGLAPLIRQYSGFDEIADQENFIVVYVQGVTGSFGNSGWNVGLSSEFNSVDDVGLFKALIKYFELNYNINSSKIFSSGMSMGGFMSYRLACELDNINSIGSVTGSMARYINCEPKTKKSIIHFHGESDTVVPYNGGDWLYSAQEAHEFWKTYNQCVDQSLLTLPDANGDGQSTSRLISYNCSQNKIVELYSLEGEAHTWYSQDWGHDVSSSELIWKFFKNQ